jgi:hypothetical protein
MPERDLSNLKIKGSMVEKVPLMNPYRSASMNGQGAVVYPDADDQRDFCHAYYTSGLGFEQIKAQLIKDGWKSPEAVERLTRVPLDTLEDVYNQAVEEERGIIKFSKSMASKPTATYR